MTASCPNVTHPAFIDVMRSLDFVLAIRTANDLQPDGGNRIEFGSPGFGHIVTVIVPLKKQSTKLKLSNIFQPVTSPYVFPP